MEFYKEFSVTSGAQRFINKIWRLNNTSSKAIEPKSILPNGCQNIAIVDGSGAHVRTRDANYYLAPGCYLCAQMTAKVEVVLSGDTKITLIQLHPWTLSALIDFEMDNFIDQIEKVSDSFLDQKIRLHAENQEELNRLILSINERFSEIGSVCIERLVEKICKDILWARGECKVADLVNKYECSMRTIQILFKRTTGLRLKQYIDIIRMRSAVDSIVGDSEEQGKVTRVAMEHQYYDQTHFVKSFRKIVKLTPSEFDRDNFILSDIKC